MSTAPHTRLETVAREVFGLTELRSGQREAMEAVLAGRDVLAVMATGYGKSAIYQVPALVRDGITVVVSPLISLQADQIRMIESGPHPPTAVAVNSAQTAAENAAAWEAVDEDARFLFLSPEQLTGEEVQERLAGLDIAMVVVDEAHCVSSWGHDFRPDYRRLAAVIDRLGHPPVVALTATASPPVRGDIITDLGLADPVVIARGFDRPNLRLEVRRCVTAAEQWEQVSAAAARHTGPGLLYVATRSDADRYADELVARGVRAAAYHAGLPDARREQVHAQFSAGEIDVVAATSAFGMGIDKPDVRFVVHAAVTDSLDSYYQQIGRAGRDGEPALAQLFYRPEDLGLRRFFAAHTADPDLLTAIHRTVRRATDPVGLSALADDLDRPQRQVTEAVNLLTHAGALTDTADGLVAEAASTAAAVDEALALVEVADQIDRSRVEMMRGYAETDSCRRRFLLGYFGEQLAGPCGNCDVCDELSTGGDGAPSDPPFPAGAAVIHDEWGRGTVMRAETDRITVFFDRLGYRVLDLAAVAAAEVLTRG